MPCGTVFSFSAKSVTNIQCHNRYGRRKISTKTVSLMPLRNKCVNQRKSMNWIGSELGLTITNTYFRTHTENNLFFFPCHSIQNRFYTFCHVIKHVCNFRGFWTFVVPIWYSMWSFGILKGKQKWELCITPDLYFRRHRILFSQRKTTFIDN